MMLFESLEVDWINPSFHLVRLDYFKRFPCLNRIRTSTAFQIVIITLLYVLRFWSQTFCMRFKINVLAARRWNRRENAPCSSLCRQTRSYRVLHGYCDQSFIPREGVSGVPTLEPPGPLGTVLTALCGFMPIKQLSRPLITIPFKRERSTHLKIRSSNIIIIRSRVIFKTSPLKRIKLL